MPMCCFPVLRGSALPAGARRAEGGAHTLPQAGGPRARGGCAVFSCVCSLADALSLRAYGTVTDRLLVHPFVSGSRVHTSAGCLRLHVPLGQRLVLRPSLLSCPRGALSWGAGNKTEERKGS